MKGGSSSTSCTGRRNIGGPSIAARLRSATTADRSAFEHDVADDALSEAGATHLDLFRFTQLSADRARGREHILYANGFGITFGGWVLLGRPGGIGAGPSARQGVPAALVSRREQSAANVDTVAPRCLRVLAMVTGLRLQLTEPRKPPTPAALNCPHPMTT